MDSLSSLLLNVSMDGIIKMLKASNAYRLSVHRFNIICTTNEAVLIAESEDGLQRLVFEFNKLYKLLNMKKISKLKLK